MKQFLKVILSVVVVFALSLSLAGCGNDKPATDPPKELPTVSEPTESDAPLVPDAGLNVPAPNPDDPWDGLIIEWTLESNLGYDKFPTSVVLDPDKYKEYLSHAIEWYAAYGKTPSMATINVDQVKKEVQATDFRLVNRDGTQPAAQLDMGGRPLNQTFPDVGTVVKFTISAGSWDVEFTYTDGTTSHASDIGMASETSVFYSLDLERVLTPEEVENAFLGKWEH